MQKHAVHLWLLEAKQCLQKVEKQEEEWLAVNLVSCLPQKLSARTACNIMSQKSNHHHHCQNGTITVHLSSRCFTQGTFEENWSSQRRRSNTDAQTPGWWPTSLCPILFFPLYCIGSHSSGCQIGPKMGPNIFQPFIGWHICLTLTGPRKKKVPHFLEIEVTCFKEIIYRGTRL